MIKTIDGAAFSRMMLSAAAEIDLNKQKVNELNVFPVPDGDTGTNMSMTLSAASTELRKADGLHSPRPADKTASAAPARRKRQLGRDPVPCCSAAFPSLSRASSRPTQGFCRRTHCGRGGRV